MRSADMHVVGTKSLVGTVIGELVDADKQWIGPLGNRKGITDMIAMRMGQDNEISSQLSRFDRACRVVIDKGIDEKNLAIVGCDLKRRMRKVSEFHLHLQGLIEKKWYRKKSL